MGTTNSKNKTVPPTFILIMADDLDKKGRPRTQNETLEAVVALFRSRHGEPDRILTHRDFTGVMKGIRSFPIKSLPLYHFLVKMGGAA